MQVCWLYMRVNQTHKNAIAGRRKVAFSFMSNSEAGREFMLVVIIQLLTYKQCCVCGSDHIASKVLLTGAACPNSLTEAFNAFHIIEKQVPRLREYAQQFNKLKDMPWMEIAEEIANSTNRQDERLESAKDIMSIAQLRRYVTDWRTSCLTVDKLINWTLFECRNVTDVLKQLSRPGAYEQSRLCS